MSNHEDEGYWAILSLFIVSLIVVIILISLIGNHIYG